MIIYIYIHTVHMHYYKWYSEWNLLRIGVPQLSSADLGRSWPPPLRSCWSRSQMFPERIATVDGRNPAPPWKVKTLKKKVGCLPCINWCRISEPAKQYVGGIWWNHRREPMGCPDFSWTKVWDPLTFDWEIWVGNFSDRVTGWNRSALLKQFVFQVCPSHFLDSRGRFLLKANLLYPAWCVQTGYSLYSGLLFW